MNTNESTLTAWSAEISAEVDALESELSSARAEDAKAERAYQIEADRWSELHTVAARGLGSQGAMSGPLYGRLRNGREEALRPLSRARGAARARVKTLENQIGERRDALAQIARALEPTKPTNVREIGARPKKPALVDFDNIVLPKEAIQ